MAINVRCSGCGHEYQLADEQAGLHVRCRQCENEFEVPKQPERFEAIMPQPFSRRPLTPEEQRSINEALAYPKTPRWRYVVAGLLGAMMVMFLACGGLTVVVVTQAQNATRLAAVELARAQEEFQRERDARNEQDRKDREKRDEEARKDREQARVERAEMQRRLESIEKKMITLREGGLDLEKLDLAKFDPKNIDDLLGLFGEGMREKLQGALGKLKSSGLPIGIRNVDDAIKALNSKARGDQLAGLNWAKLNSQPNDAAKARAVTEAIQKLIREGDEEISESAKTAKLLWTGDF